MTSFFIGQILEVKPTERMDKNTRTKVFNTEVTVMFDGYDEEGYRVPSIENAQLADHQYDLLKDKLGKFIAIPYMTIHTKQGTYTFPNDAIAPLVLDSNPVDYDSFKRPVSGTKAKA